MDGGAGVRGSNFRFGFARRIISSEAMQKRIATLGDGALVSSPDVGSPSSAMLET